MIEMSTLENIFGISDPFWKTGVIFFNNLVLFKEMLNWIYMYVEWLSG